MRNENTLFCVSSTETSPFGTCWSPVLNPWSWGTLACRGTLRMRSTTKVRVGQTTRRVLHHVTSPPWHNVITAPLTFLFQPLFRGCRSSGWRRSRSTSDVSLRPATSGCSVSCRQNILGDSSRGAGQKTHTPTKWAKGRGLVYVYSKQSSSFWTTEGPHIHSQGQTWIMEQKSKHVWGLLKVPCSTHFQSRIPVEQPHRKTIQKPL